MSTPEPCDEIRLEKEYIGIPPPHDVHLPTASEIIILCDEKQPRGSIILPEGSNKPVFWIKYGNAVFWNEVAAQAMAYHELRRLGSSVRAPAVFYAFRYDYRTFIVMEYIPGKTSAQCLKEAKSPEEKEHIIGLVALSLGELHRIPVAAGSRPAAVDGGRIRHSIFDEQEAPRHYENVDQLEIHLNEFLKVVSKSGPRLTNLSLEPMVFCYSDLWPDNFMIDDTGRAAVIDFADDNRLGFDISERVKVPTTEGVDNSEALAAVSGRMAIESFFLYRLGQRLPGGDKETQERIARECDLPY
ncbi:hypothetical protein BR93DRAFT_966660 [Coniochaeta sp. PMI_546]|nr:hypothetical protein BR93DRAFT_966660 [Coniochaeta sp. PMI_546]